MMQLEQEQVMKVTIWVSKAAAGEQESLKSEKYVAEKTTIAIITKDT